DLVGIEAVSLLGSVEAVHAIAVELLGQHVGQVGVPHLIRPLRHRDAMTLPRRLGRLEETELYLRRMFSEQGEVDARAVPGCSQRIRPTRPDPHEDFPFMQIPMTNDE